MIYLMIPFVRQIRTPSRLLDIVEDDDASTTKYFVKVYALSQVGELTEHEDYDMLHYYPPNADATPLEVWTIENPDPTDYNEILITHQVGDGTPKEMLFSYNADADAWTFTKDEGETLEKYYLATDDSDTQTYVREFSKPDDEGERQICYKKSKEQKEYDWGMPVIKELQYLGPSSSLTTTYSYYLADTASLGKKKKKWRTGSRWEQYVYEETGAGRLLTKI